MHVARHQANRELLRIDTPWDAVTEARDGIRRARPPLEHRLWAVRPVLVWRLVEIASHPPTACSGCRGDREANYMPLPHPSVACTRGISYLNQ
mmetsp:Transcript_74622/g.177645  ORF Transcript_74622/g.177645 Transcript_74622/m.177645 type:complete len:93 (-) Transcript_74622:8-286(-)